MLALVPSDSYQWCVCLKTSAPLKQQVKARYSASFNIYFCTMWWQIVFDRLDHISHMHEACAGSRTDRPNKTGYLLCLGDKTSVLSKQLIPTEVGFSCITNKSYQIIIFDLSVGRSCKGLFELHFLWVSYFSCCPFDSYFAFAMMSERDGMSIKQFHRCLTCFHKRFSPIWFCSQHKPGECILSCVHQLSECTLVKFAD